MIYSWESAISSMSFWTGVLLSIICLEAFHIFLAVSLILNHMRALSNKYMIILLVNARKEK